jgi:antitoxin VapB
MTRSTIVKNKRGQTVRLPKLVAFPDSVHRVEIIKIGQSRIVSPIGKRWDDFFRNGPRVSADFMAER